MQALQAGCGPVAAARKAGYAESTARDGTGRIMNQLRRKLVDQLEKYDLTDEWIIKLLKRNAEAMNEQTGAPAASSMPAIKLILKLRGDLDRAKDDSQLTRAAEELKRIFVDIDLQAMFNLAEGKEAPTLKELRLRRERENGGL